MSFLNRVDICAPPDFSGYRDFRVDGVRVGRVEHNFARRLKAFPDVFHVGATSVDLAPDLDGFETRSAVVDGVLKRLADDGLIPGWRDESYPVGPFFAAPQLFQMERAAVPLFGVRAYGVHLNGFVRRGDTIDMWIGRRSFDKPVAPGKLDQIVAGGQPVGLSLAANLRKESAEEANIPPHLINRARPVGAISYCTKRSEGLRDDVLFCYDVELPADFTPVNTDGEMAEFTLWPIRQVAKTVEAGDDFKFNCALVVIDFLIRHGLIAPDHPDYVALVKGLHG